MGWISRDLARGFRRRAQAFTRGNIAPRAIRERHSASKLPIGDGSVKVKDAGRPPWSCYSLVMVFEKGVPCIKAARLP